MDYMNKQGSKVSRFFEWVFSLVMINLFTITLSLFVITIFPALTAAVSTIDGMRYNGPGKVIKTYFLNFKTYMERAFLVGIVVEIMLAICAFSMYFYKTRMPATNWISQAGFYAMGVVLLLILFLSLHLPLIIANFPKLRYFDTFRLAIFISFRYILSTLILLVVLIIMVVGFIGFPIWVFFGVSLPLLMGIKLTESTYFYLKEIDIVAIMDRTHRIAEGEEDDDEDNPRN